MDNRSKFHSNISFPTSFIKDLETKIGKLPASADVTNLPPFNFPPVNLPLSNLPPSDNPPTCPTDKEMLGDEGCRLVMVLENRLKDFISNGKLLSEKASKVPLILEAKLSNLGSAKVSLLPDNGLTLTIFIQQVIDSVKILSQQDHPFPKVSAILNEKSPMSFSDILYTFNLLHEYIINPQYNHAFKTRAIQCALLTLAYDKLRISPLNVADIENELISPLQRLTRLDLFAKDPLKEFASLRDCKNVSQANQQVINHAINYLQELQYRAQQISIAVNEMIKAISIVSARNPEYKRYSSDSLNLLDLTKQFTAEIVEYIMEVKFQDENKFAAHIKEKIGKDFTNNLYLKFITPSDNLYHDLTQLLSNSKLDRQEIINKLIKVDLHKIHEDSTLVENIKLQTMKLKITEIYNKLASSLNSSIFYRQSDLADKLLAFIKNDMSKYVLLSSASSNENLSCTYKS